MKRLVRAPVLHFVLLGGVLFTIAHGSSGWRRAQAQTRAPLTISAAAIEGERLAFIARAGRAPAAAEMMGLAETLADDELLWREAAALHLDRDDPVVRRRLVRNLRFLRGVDGEGDGGNAADGDLYAEALSLGLDRTDEVVRRRLIERLRLRIQQQVRALEPTDTEIDAYVARNRERFVEPERVGLTQIFLSRERRGQRLAADTQELLVRLETESISPGKAVRFGDPCLTPARLPPQSRRSLLRRFGAEFAERVLRQAPGGWAGPVPSAYGLHLVWVHEAVPSRLPSSESVRASARELLLAEREDAALKEALQRLRARYEIRVADVAERGRVSRLDPHRIGKAETAQPASDSPPLEPAVDHGSPPRP